MRRLLFSLNNLTFVFQFFRMAYLKYMILGLVLIMSLAPVEIVEAGYGCHGAWNYNDNECSVHCLATVLATGSCRWFTGFLRCHCNN